MGGAQNGATTIFLLRVRRDKRSTPPGPIDFPARDPSCAWCVFTNDLAQCREPLPLRGGLISNSVSDTSGCCVVVFCWLSLAHALLAATSLLLPMARYKTLQLNILQEDGPDAGAVQVAAGRAEHRSSESPSD